MGTPLTEVYDSFLSQVSDHSLANSTDEELKSELEGYLKPSLRKFYQCKNDLTVDYEKQEFIASLSNYEIEIVASSMLSAYLKTQVNNSEALKQTLSDKDFRIYSQANHIRELNLLSRRAASDVQKMITKYTYMDFGYGDKT